MTSDTAAFADGSGTVSATVRQLLGRSVDRLVVTSEKTRRFRKIVMATVWPTGEPTLDVVLKTYGAGDPEGDGTWSAVVGRRLENAGMGAVSSLCVAPTYGASPGALLCARAPGELWRSTFATTAAASASKRVGAWLAVLQGTRLELPVSRARGADALADQLLELEAIGGPTAVGLRAIRLEMLPRLQEPQPLAPSHGNAHPENFFVDLSASPPVLTAIDLDTVAAREPAHYLGYAMAQALIRTRRRPGPEHGYAAAASVLNGYRQAGGLAADDRIALQVARALVQAVHHEAVVLAKGIAPVLEDLPVIDALLRAGIGALRPLAPRPA